MRTRYEHLVARQGRAWGVPGLERAQFERELLAEVRKMPESTDTETVMSRLVECVDDAYGLDTEEDAIQVCEVIYGVYEAYTGKHDMRTIRAKFLPQQPCQIEYCDGSSDNVSLNLKPLGQNKGQCASDAIVYTKDTTLGQIREFDLLMRSTDKKCEDLCPISHKLDVPFVERTECQPLDTDAVIQTQEVKFTGSVMDMVYDEALRAVKEGYALYGDDVVDRVTKVVSECLEAWVELGIMGVSMMDGYSAIEWVKDEEGVHFAVNGEYEEQRRKYGRQTEEGRHCEGGASGGEPC